MTSIATIAAEISKPSKKDAQAIIKALFAKTEDHRTINELAQLYSYFMPAIPKAKSGFAWVAQAMGKKDVRYYLNYVHVTEKHIEATDGHRLHRIPNSDSLAPGFYLSNGDKAHEPDFARFPDTARVIPTKKNRTAHSVTLSRLPVLEDGPKLLVQELPGAVYVNREYLAAAAAGDRTEVYVGADNESILLIDDEKTAVIMPTKPPKSQDRAAA